jgi:hypothetical protein
MKSEANNGVNAVSGADRKAPSNIDDPEVVAAINAYLSELQQGGFPSRLKLLERFPELAEPLAACLDSLDFMHRVAPQLWTSSEPGLDRSNSQGPAETEKRLTLGDFRIIREIGHGGMGIVYEATQLSLDRRVALKVLPFAAILDDRQLARFKNEAQAAASLNHPHIVNIIFVGHERGVHFYAMRYVDGHTLAEVIHPTGRASLAASGEKETNVEPDEGRAQAVLETRPIAAITTQFTSDRRAYFQTVARLGLQAAEALEYAHQTGIVHRDIKPSNLLLDRDEHLWVTDFGLAMTESGQHLTMSGDILGTLRYMSPEQASGNGKLLDRRTDIYSLGATLYELLTRRPLFASQDRKQLSRQVIEQEPTPLRRIDPKIPIDLETIVLRAIAKERELR